MNTEKIYHYTNVESLALILSSGKIRFTRLDRVDDVSESQTHAGINFGQYFFVSCWTKNEVDNIAQWKMYGGDMGGVRIELPKYPFRYIRMQSNRFLNISGEHYGPLSSQDLMGDKHFIFPSIGRSFAGPVEYVDNVKSQYELFVNRTMEEGKIKLTIKNMFDLPRLKAKMWQFQEEYRFVLQVAPLMPHPIEGPHGTMLHPLETFTDALINNIDPGISFIDVPIDPKSLANMTITTGPLCSAGSAVCVQALVSKFAPSALVQASPLTGSLRRK